MVYKPTYNWGGHPVPLPYYIAGNGPQCSPMTSHYIPGFTDWNDRLTPVKYTLLGGAAEVICGYTTMMTGAPIYIYVYNLISVPYTH